jgi:hypothetical protein
MWPSYVFMGMWRLSLGQGWAGPVVGSSVMSDE